MDPKKHLDSNSTIRGDFNTLLSTPHFHLSTEQLDKKLPYWLCSVQRFSPTLMAASSLCWSFYLQHGSFLVSCHPICLFWLWVPVLLLLVRLSKSAGCVLCLSSPSMNTLSHLATDGVLIADHYWVIWSLQHCSTLSAAFLCSWVSRFLSVLTYFPESWPLHFTLANGSPSA